MRKEGSLAVSVLLLPKVPRVVPKRMSCVEGIFFRVGLDGDIYMYTCTRTGRSRAARRKSL